MKAARPRHPPRKKPEAHSPHLPPQHCSIQSCSSRSSASAPPQQSCSSRSSASVPPQQSQSTPSRSTDTVDISNIVKREEEGEEEEKEKARSRKTRGGLEHAQTNLPLIEELDTTDSREGVSDDLILDDSDVPSLI